MKSMLEGSRTAGSVLTEMSKALNVSLFWMLTANRCWLRGAVNEAGAGGHDVEEISAIQTVSVLWAWLTGRVGRKVLADSAASISERRARFFLKRVYSPMLECSTAIVAYPG